MSIEEKRRQHLFDQYELLESLYLFHFVYCVHAGGEYAGAHATN
jgi:hypothetical protein